MQLERDIFRRFHVREAVLRVTFDVTTALVFDSHDLEDKRLRGGGGGAGVE